MRRLRGGVGRFRFFPFVPDHPAQDERINDQAGDILDASADGTAGDVVHQPQRTAADETRAQLHAAGIRRNERGQQHGRDGKQAVKIFVPAITEKDRDCRERKSDHRAFEINIDVHTRADDDFGQCRADVAQHEMVDAEQQARHGEQQKQPLVVFLHGGRHGNRVGDVSQYLRQGKKVHFTPT